MWCRFFSHTLPLHCIRYARASSNEHFSSFQLKTVSIVYTFYSNSIRSTPPSTMFDIRIELNRTNGKRQLMLIPIEINMHSLRAKVTQLLRPQSDSIGLNCLFCRWATCLRWNEYIKSLDLCKPITRLAVNFCAIICSAPRHTVFSWYLCAVIRLSLSLARSFSSIVFLLFVARRRQIFRIFCRCCLFTQKYNKKKEICIRRLALLRLRVLWCIPQ